MGRQRLDFLEKTGTGEEAGVSDASDQVQTLGQKALALVRSSDVGLLSAVRGSVGDDDGMSDDDDDDGGGRDADSDTDSDESDTAAMLDIDWDTSGWTINEIESACSTLVTDCENTSSSKPKRRELATKMLVRLMDRHASAAKYVEVALETVVNRGLPTMNFGIDEKVFNISHLLAALGPRLPDKLSRLNVVPRVIRMMLLELDLAARVAQNRFRVRKKRAMMAHDLPPDVRARQRLMQNMKTDDLNGKWRLLRTSATGGCVPQDAKLAYMRLLLAMCARDSSKYYRMSRRQIVESNGLIAVISSTVVVGEMQEVACGLLLEIAQERSLLRPVLQTQVVSSLALLLRPSCTSDQKCMALDVLDMMGTNAMDSDDINADPTTAERGDASDSDSEGGDRDESEKLRRQLSIEIRQSFAAAKHVKALIALIGEVRASTDSPGRRFLIKYGRHACLIRVWLPSHSCPLAANALTCCRIRKLSLTWTCSSAASWCCKSSQARLAITQCSTRSLRSPALRSSA